MHIHEGVLHPAVLVTGWAVAAGGLAFGLKRLPTEKIMPAALLAAGFFVASFVHFSVGAVNLHLTLNALVGLFLGWGAFPALFTGLLLQALLFNYGGVTVLGVNTVVMALPAAVFGGLLRRHTRKKGTPGLVPVVGCVALTLLASNALYTLALAASGKEFYPLARIAFLAALPLIAVEGAICVCVVRTIARVRPWAFSVTQEEE